MKFCENTDKQTHTQTNTQTNRHGHYNTSPSPYGGRGKNYFSHHTLEEKKIPALYVGEKKILSLKTCKNKAIRDGRPRPPRHQGFIAISYGGSELRHRSILETITHRPKCQNTKVVGIIFPYILTPIPNLYDHSFPRYGQITFLTFRRPTTLTFDLKF